MRTDDRTRYTAKFWAKKRYSEKSSFQYGGHSATLISQLGTVRFLAPERVGRWSIKFRLSLVVTAFWCIFAAFCCHDHHDSHNRHDSTLSGTVSMKNLKRSPFPTNQRYAFFFRNATQPLILLLSGRHEYAIGTNR